MLNALLTDSGKQKTNGTINGERKNEEKVMEDMAALVSYKHSGECNKCHDMWLYARQQKPYPDDCFGNKYSMALYLSGGKC